MAILLKLQLLRTKWAVINQQHQRKGMISESLQRYCKQFVRKESAQLEMHSHWREINFVVRRDNWWLLGFIPSADSLSWNIWTGLNICNNWHHKKRSLSSSEIDKCWYLFCGKLDCYSSLGPLHFFILHRYILDSTSDRYNKLIFFFLVQIIVMLSSAIGKILLLFLHSY